MPNTIYAFKDMGDAAIKELISEAKPILLENDIDALGFGDACYMTVNKFGREEYSLTELCVTTIRKKIGDGGIFRLIVLEQAFNELTSDQKKKLFSNCKKYLVFIRAKGCYSIYRVCNDADCSKPTYAVYCGGSLMMDGLATEKNADLYIKSILEGEESDKTIDDAVEVVAPSKPKGHKI